MISHQRQLGARAILLLVTFFWGATFSLVKQSLDSIPPYWFLTLRFGLAAATFWVWIAADRARRPSAVPSIHVAGAGAIMGGLYFLGYAFQTTGLLTTTATKSAFITGTVSFWTPLLGILLLRRRLQNQIVFGVLFGMAGLLLLVSEKGLATFSERGLVLGDAFTLICALMYAFHILWTKRVTGSFPALWLVAIQSTIVAAGSVIASFAFHEHRSFNHSATVYGSILACALFATVFASWAQTLMQRHITEEETAVIFLCEPVFGALTAWLWLGEIMTLHQWLGAALIMAAAALPEAKAIATLRASSHRVRLE